MFINNDDLELLKDIENYLFNINKENMIIENSVFAIKTSDIKDDNALFLYLKLYNLNEKLIQKKLDSNKKNWNRIKEKRKTNKNYAR